MVTKIYTIGFTKKGAEAFFGLLQEADVKKLVDVRINNRSQLAGFAKRDDLQFFLSEILDAKYEHRTDLAPTQDLLDDWRNDRVDWETYERQFLQLMEDRQIEDKLSRSFFDSKTVLLCSEHEPEHCHRRLIVEYLDKKWGGVEPIHLIE